MGSLLLLRLDRPDWPRPLRLGRCGPVLAGVLLVLDLVFIGFGLIFPEGTGYGGYARIIVRCPFRNGTPPSPAG